VDNGSTDDTSLVLKKLLGKKKIRSKRLRKNLGYGGGILAGLSVANGNILGWTHADMQTDPLDTLKGLYTFSKSSNTKTLFIKGKRYGRPLGDTFFTVGMSVFETFLMGTVLFDINAQPTLFTREFYESWVEPPKDFSLDLFAYYMAKKNGLKIKRFPVRFGKRVHGISHWNVNWEAKKKFIERTVSYSLKLRQNVIENKKNSHEDYSSPQK